MPSISTPAPNPPFDIVATYNGLLESDPELTMPVAAIEALVEALSTLSSSTVVETLTQLQYLTATLKSSVANPISLSAGTDLFQRYLITSLNRGTGPEGDFDNIRRHLLSNGRVFVERAKAAREQIAAFGRHFIRDNCTVLTNGGSRVVGALLRSAADEGSIRFKVIYVLPSPPSDASSRTGLSSTEGAATIKALREKGVPVATIPESAVAYAMGKVDMVIVGAEGVVENGGIISRLGTYQIGVLAKAMRKHFYVVAESHKFVRLYPLGQYDLPIEQSVIEFKTDGEDEMSGESKKGSKKSRLEDAVDYTPPDLISGIVTESGVLTPSAVSEELIKIWF
ncbi:nagb/rpia/CoA transferase-like protein [Aulographum hederae CBS 113979]|uniref:Translation initiation factor eIF2B subunit alpha n=1 Tax=Aulographum hederae CBS 113979 TaxID=1176131 RepID=A0A6G1HD79_9PEZI|nr:nagb/rpia/CoA transferase-like protein [Aulographum hederae CBS 113979]